MAKKAILLLAEGFEEIEAVTCVNLLRRAAIEVTLVSTAGLEVTGSRKIAIRADKKINEINQAFDACILPGGMPGAKNIAASQKATRLIEKMARENKIIAAICASPAIILSPLGLIKNKKATCYPGMENYFPRSAVYQNKAVVIDKNLITGQGPAAAFEFALAVIKKISGEKLCQKVKKATLACLK